MTEESMLKRISTIEGFIKTASSERSVSSKYPENVYEKTHDDYDTEIVKGIYYSDDHDLLEECFYATDSDILKPTKRFNIGLCILHYKYGCTYVEIGKMFGVGRSRINTRCNSGKYTIHWMAELKLKNPEIVIQTLKLDELPRTQFPSYLLKDYNYPLEDVNTRGHRKDYLPLRELGQDPEKLKEIDAEIEKIDEKTFDRMNQALVRHVNLSDDIINVGARVYPLHVLGLENGLDYHNRFIMSDIRNEMRDHEKDVIQEIYHCKEASNKLIFTITCLNAMYFYDMSVNDIQEVCKNITVPQIARLIQLFRTFKIFSPEESGIRSRLEEYVTEIINYVHAVQNTLWTCSPVGDFGHLGDISCWRYKRIRSNSKKTQKMVSEETGISVGKIGKFERNEIQLTSDEMKAYIFSITNDKYTQFALHEMMKYKQNEINFKNLSPSMYQVLYDFGRLSNAFSEQNLKDIWDYLNTIKLDGSRW